MDGSKELSQLAHLLQISAEALQQVATLRPDDQVTLEALSERVDQVAAEIEQLIARRMSS